MIDPRFSGLRYERGRAFRARNARTIRRLQRAGVADSSVDADVEAVALSAMVSRTAYITVALGMIDSDVESLVAVLTLWAEHPRV